jgi:hypothetical protein
VRLLETSHGTGAVTRVHIDSQDGQSTWGTTGVGENVVAASWQALVDALEYRVQPPGRQPARHQPAGRGVAKRKPKSQAKAAKAARARR